MPKPISLDEVLSTRAPSILSTKRGEAISKVFKSPSTWDETGRTAKFTMTAQVEDRYRDVVVTTGIDTKAFEKNPVALYNHDHNRIIGNWSNLERTERGRKPHMDGTVNFLDEGFTAATDEAVRLVQAGALRGASIGFMPIEYEWIRDEEGDGYTGGIRFLKSDLIECSVVAVPANPAALVKAAGGDGRLSLAMFEYVLDEWARTPDGLIVPRAEYEKAYSVVKVTAIGGKPVVGDPSMAVDIMNIVSREVKALVDKSIAEIRGLSPADRIALDTTLAEERSASEVADAEDVRPPAEPEIKAASPEDLKAARARIAALEADLALAAVD